jgi:ribosomal protein L32
MNRMLFTAERVAPRSARVAERAPDAATSRQRRNLELTHVTDRLQFAALREDVDADKQLARHHR